MSHFAGRQDQVWVRRVHSNVINILSMTLERLQGSEHHKQ